MEPDRVYVIQPNTELAIADGTLRVTPRTEVPGRHMPVDFFFRALARDQGRYAIGIVLSGTGSDGAQGLAAIKAEGGITFARRSSRQNTAACLTRPSRPVASISCSYARGRPAAA